MKLLRRYATAIVVIRQPKKDTLFAVVAASISRYARVTAHHGLTPLMLLLQAIRRWSGQEKVNDAPNDIGPPPRPPPLSPSRYEAIAAAARGIAAPLMSVARSAIVGGDIIQIRARNAATIDVKAMMLRVARLYAVAAAITRSTSDTTEYFSNIIKHDK